MGLSVCPHCGRDVRPAGPRWGLWAAGAAALALIVLWSLGSLPVERAGQQIARARTRLAGLVQVLGPVAQGAANPMQPLETPQAVALRAESPAPGASDTPAAPEPSPELPTEVAPTVEAAVTPTAVITDTGASADTATPSAAPLGASATAVLALPPTVTPTAAPPTVAAPTPTAAPPPTVAPTPTAAPTPTVAPTPTRPVPTATAAKAAPAAGGTVTYRVQSGDALSTIAAKFNVSLDALLAANQLTTKSILRIGQELVIPGSGVPVAPTATPPPRPTATSALPSPSPAPYLAAPVLVGPGDGSSYRESEEINLSWQPVPGIAAGNQYQVTMRWTQQTVPQEYYWFTTATATRVPPWLWGRADQPDRKYTWFVKVVQVTTDGRGGELAIPLSPASSARSFYWN